MASIQVRKETLAVAFIRMRVTIGHVFEKITNRAIKVFAERIDNH